MIKKISLSLSVLVACSNHPVKATSYTKKCITTAIVATAFVTNKAQKHAPTTMARYRNHHMPPKVHTAHLPYASFLHRPKSTSHFYNGSTTSSTSKAALPIIAALGLCTGLGVYAGANYDKTALCFPNRVNYASIKMLDHYSESGNLYISESKVNLRYNGKGSGRITVYQQGNYEKIYKFIVKVHMRTSAEARWVVLAKSPVFEMPNSKGRKQEEPSFWNVFFPSEGLSVPHRTFYYEFRFDPDDIPNEISSGLYKSLAVSITERGTGWWW